MRYLVFASLLALQIIFGFCDDTEVITWHLETNRIVLKHEIESGKLENCTLEHGQKRYSIYPVQPGNKVPGYYSGSDEYCSQTIRDKDASFAGLWTMTSKTNEGEFKKKFEIHVTQEILTIPTGAITVTDGQWIRFGLDLPNEADVTSCNVTDRDDRTLNLMEKIEDMYGSCGIRIRANASTQGYWYFYARVGDYLLYEGRSKKIYVHTETNNNWDGKVEVLEYTWDIEAEEVADINEDNVVFCQWTRPDGTKMPLMFHRSCRLKVDFASPYHNGTWRVTYATPGNTNLQHKDVLIKVNDRNRVECRYDSPPNSDEINILCKTGQRSLQFCSFIKPNNSRLILPEGVGNDAYSYYGRGYSKEGSGEFAECGVTINNPDHDDFGVWTCEIGINNGNIRGAVIDVVKTKSAMKDHAHQVDYPPVFVKRGNSFKLYCKTDAKLDYCWIRSPNGTVYSVPQNEVSNNNLKYDGKGFNMGECSAIIPSDVADTGDWSCHMGIQGGFEVDGKVPVTVAESYLIAHKDTVFTSETTNLTCRSIAGGESTVQYCRWVRPNGQGINRADSLRYTQSHGIHHCSLIISDVHPEDLGKWTCFASLTKSVSQKMEQEQWATVRVRSVEAEESRTASILTIVLGTGFLVIALIGAGYAVLFVYKRRNPRITKNPPPYYPEDYPIPNGIRTGADPIRNDKDYKY